AVLRYAASGDKRGGGNSNQAQDPRGRHDVRATASAAGPSARKFSQPPPRLLRAGLLSPVVPVDVQPAANIAASTTAVATTALRKYVMQLRCAPFTRASTGPTSQVR